MKTIKKVAINPVFVEHVPEVLEENSLYISEAYKTAVHSCLCGCGSQTITPLNSTGWRLVKENNGTVSLSPSIGNYQFDCQSHYIITKNIANFV